MKSMHEKTKQILALFEEISAIPRCSKNEEKIAAFRNCLGRKKMTLPQNKTKRATY